MRGATSSHPSRPSVPNPQAQEKASKSPRPPADRDVPLQVEEVPPHDVGQLEEAAMAGIVGWDLQSSGHDHQPHQMKTAHGRRQSNRVTSRDRRLGKPPFPIQPIWP